MAPGRRRRGTICSWACGWGAAAGAGDDDAAADRDDAAADGRCRDWCETRGADGGQSASAGAVRRRRWTPPMAARGWGGRSWTASCSRMCAGALWTRALIEAARRGAGRPALLRVVVGVDPPASADGRCVRDRAVRAGRRTASPRCWRMRASRACRPRAGRGRWRRRAEAAGADRVVAEKNQGGDMVESVLRARRCRAAGAAGHAQRAARRRGPSRSRRCSRRRRRGSRGASRSWRTNCAGWCAGAAMRAGALAGPGRCDGLGGVGAGVRVEGGGGGAGDLGGLRR